MPIHDDADGTPPMACGFAPDRPEGCPAVDHDRSATVPGPADDRPASATVVPIRPLGTTVDGPPLFCFPGEAVLAWSFTALVHHLDLRVPIYGVQTSTPAPTIAAYASRHLAEIRRIAPHGPYQLLGWSVGGLIAHEVAARLRAAGEQVTVVLLATGLPAPGPPDLAPIVPGGAERRSTPRRPTEPGPTTPPRTATTPGPEFVDRFAAVLGIDADITHRSAAEAAVIAAPWTDALGLTTADLDRLGEASAATARAGAGHRPSILSGDLTLCVPGRAPDGTDRPDPGADVRNWRPYVAGTVTGVVVDAGPGELIDPELMPDIAGIIATVSAPWQTR
ncbi:thioesterase domain-containing protein [Nocardia mangyaensis]|uniref:thioesterase domain-containing protein n=1 Tax=Nocardia mangyaensis TaxID=2213200 RepID=UPI00267662F1|nr:thioesterase domain-containing protein [Nocardia mangyaensis]MDO3646072.1 thioesterase domain-containing protein [Nocardia mangyaensis]